MLKWHLAGLALVVAGLHRAGRVFLLPGSLADRDRGDRAERGREEHTGDRAANAVQPADGALVPVPIGQLTPVPPAPQ